MNVSILAIFTLWTLRRLALGDVAASAAAITLILAYAALTKEGLPVWRAALMFAVYLATRLLYRDRAMLNTRGAAGFALLIADMEKPPPCLRRTPKDQPKGSFRRKIPPPTC
jgi:predicted membrane metal-binding protein